MVTNLTDLARRQKLQLLQKRIRENEAAVREELVVCRKQARRTARYENLVRDGRKLKDELEKVNRSVPFNPTKLAHLEAMSKKKYLGDRRGKTGPDTVHGL